MGALPPFSSSPAPSLSFQQRRRGRRWWLRRRRVEVSQSYGAAGGQGGIGGNGGALYSQSSPAFISCTFAGNSGGRGRSRRYGWHWLYAAPYGDPVGDGGPGGDGAAGGSGGGLYCPGFLPVSRLHHHWQCRRRLEAAGGQGGRAGLTTRTRCRPAEAAAAMAATVAMAEVRAPGAHQRCRTCWPPRTPPPRADSPVLAAFWLHVWKGSGSPGSSGLDGSGPDLFGAFTSNGHNLIGLDDGNTGFTDGPPRQSRRLPHPAQSSRWAAQRITVDPRLPAPCCPAAQPSTLATTPYWTRL